MNTDRLRKKNIVYALANVRLIGVWVATLCSFTGCTSESYFDRISSGYYLAAETVRSVHETQVNRSSPARIAPVIRRLELIDDAAAQRGVVIYERRLSDLTPDTFKNLPVIPEPYAPIHDSRTPLPDREVRYAKVYLYAVRFPVFADNFNVSQVAQAEEEFYLFYNSAVLGGVAFVSGDTAALNRISGRTEPFDTSRPASTPLAFPATTRRNVVLDGGNDEHGFYSVVPVSGSGISPDRVLLIRVVFDLGDKFSWTDVLSGAEVFDGASQDVFNWQLNFPVARLEVEEL